MWSQTWQEQAAVKYKMSNKLVYQSQYNQSLIQTKYSLEKHTISILSLSLNLYGNESSRFLLVR